MLSAELSRAFHLMSLICACLVVGIHMPSYGKNMDVVLADGFCRIAVPFFFFASGFFLSGRINCQNWWRAAVFKRLTTLLSPFFIWTSLFLILPFLYGGRVCPLNVVDVASFYGLNIFSFPGVVPYWFIRTLFVLCLLSKLFVKFCVGRPRLWLVFLTLGWLLFSPWHDVHPLGIAPLRRILPIDSIFFFNCGICVRVWRLYDIVTYPRMLFLGIVGLILMALKIAFSLHEYSFYWIPGAFSVPFLICGLIGLLSYVRFSIKYSIYSFPIYILHSIFLQFFGMVFGRFISVGSRTEYVLIYFFTILSCIFVAVIIKRVSSRCYNILFGGR